MSVSTIASTMTTIIISCIYIDLHLYTHTIGVAVVLDLAVVVAAVVNPICREKSEKPEYPGGRMLPSEITVIVAVSVLLPTLFSAVHLYSPAS